MTPALAREWPLNPSIAPANVCSSAHLLLAAPEMAV
jgi:hypothetical protein